MSPPRLTAKEQCLVDLLAQGHTDATAARELRISPRSVTNTLRSLMDQLGVDNRFQLGLALGALHLARTRAEADAQTPAETPAETPADAPPEA